MRYLERPHSHNLHYRTLLPWLRLIISFGCKALTVPNFPVTLYQGMCVEETREQPT